MHGEGAKPMAKKANAEIAGDFIIFLRRQGLEVFKETHTLGEATRHEFLYIAPVGEPGVNTSLHELGERILPWLQASGISKSHAQIEHICRIMWSSAEDRTSSAQPAVQARNARNHVTAQTGDHRPIHRRHTSSLTHLKS
jgi:hypothetical protein